MRISNLIIESFKFPVVSDNFDPEEDNKDDDEEEGSITNSESEGADA